MTRWGFNIKLPSLFDGHITKTSQLYATIAAFDLCWNVQSTASLFVCAVLPLGTLLYFRVANVAIITYLNSICSLFAYR